MEPIHYFTFQDKTAFIHLKYVFPECIVLRDGYPQTEGLQCLRTSCPVNQNCMTNLAHRIHYLFDNVLPEVELMLVYFKTPTGSIKTGVFYRDFREPTVMTCNRSAFAKFSREGFVFSWTPTTEFLLIGTEDTNLISATDLIRTK